MQAVEIEATRVHQTPSSLAEWCADTARCNTVCFTKVHTWWKVEFASTTSWVIFNFYGKWHCRGLKETGQSGPKQSYLSFHLWLNMPIWMLNTLNPVSCVYTGLLKALLHEPVLCIFRMKWTSNLLLYKFSAPYDADAHLWLNGLDACVYQTRAGINKRYLKKVRQVWGLELQPRWGAQELKGKRGRGGDPIFRTIP